MYFLPTTVLNVRVLPTQITRIKPEPAKKMFALVETEKLIPESIATCIQYTFCQAFIVGAIVPPEHASINVLINYIDNLPTPVHFEKHVYRWYIVMSCYMCCGWYSLFILSIDITIIVTYITFKNEAKKQIKKTLDSTQVLVLRFINKTKFLYSFIVFFFLICKVFRVCFFF